MITYRIPISGLKKSTNKIYAGEHWSKRKEFKDICFDYARHFCKPVQEFGPYPIQIRYRFVFTSRVLDTTNLTYLVKVFEDALRSLKILKDDSPKYVVRTIIEVVESTKKKTKKAITGMGSAQNAKNEDWLEITAEPCNYILVDI